MDNLKKGEFFAGVAGFSALLILTILFFMLLFTGCGKKGPPLPPEMPVPEKVETLKIEAEPDGLLISWLVPDKNSDGTELTDLAGFKLYRKSFRKDCKKCPEELPLYMDIDMDAPEGAMVEGGKIIVRETDLEDGRFYHYRVSPYNKGGYFGGQSELVSIQWEVQEDQ